MPQIISPVIINQMIYQANIKNKKMWKLIIIQRINMILMEEAIQKKKDMNINMISLQFLVVGK